MHATFSRFNDQCEDSAPESMAGIVIRMSADGTRVVLVVTQDSFDMFDITDARRYQLFEAAFSSVRLDEFRELLVDVAQFGVDAVIGVPQPGLSVRSQYMNRVNGDFQVRRAIRCRQHDIRRNGTVSALYGVDGLFQRRRFVQFPQREIVRNTNRTTRRRQ